MSDLETELLLLLANAGFAIAVDDTIIPTAAIASIANEVVFVIVFDVFIMFQSSHKNILELINPLLNPVKWFHFSILSYNESYNESSTKFIVLMI
jgi:hypothetical protein